MIFSWLKRRRRRKLLERPFPAEWDAALRENVTQFAWLDEDEQRRLRRWIQVFVAETYWEGLAGLKVTGEMRVTVAAQTGILMLGFEGDYLEHLQTILIHPHIEAAPRLSRERGLVTEQVTVTHGEALAGGPVRVVWPLALRGGRIAHDGYNVVFHEVAHVLDSLDGYLDGTPPLADSALFERWGRTLRREYDRLVRLSEAGQPTVIDPYGATNEAEFFAVSTECFFERPHILAARHPEWFELLAAFYRQDPRPRLERGGFGLGRVE